MMSKKIFSVQDWENVHSEQRVPAHDESKRSSCVHLHNNVEEDVESVVSAVEAHGIDVAPRYAEWVNLGFALADACGEGGRGYFHRLSSLHHDYNQVATSPSLYAFIIFAAYMTNVSYIPICIFLSRQKQEWGRGRCRYAGNLLCPSTEIFMN